MVTKQGISWDEFHDDCASLARIIAASGQRFDMIVAVSRGGFVPARLIAESLGVKKMTAIGIGYVDTARDTREVYSMPIVSVSDTRLLVVEDALESGLSLQEAQGLLVQTEGKIVSSCALYVRADAEFEPDFFLKRLNALPSFPWE